MAHIRGRHGLAKGFLKIGPVLIGFIRKEALPTTPHASDSGVAGGPVMTEVHGGHDTAQIVFNDLPFPLTVYQTNTDLELTLTSGNQHSALSHPSVVDATSENRLCCQGGAVNLHALVHMHSGAHALWCTCTLVHLHSGAPALWCTCTLVHLHSGVLARPGLSCSAHTLHPL